MTPMFGPLGFRADDRYRNLSEPRIVEMLILAGWAYEVGSNETEMAAHATLQNWLQLGLGCRLAPTGERFFDPIEVNNFMKWSGYDGRDGFWSGRFVPLRRRLFSDLAQAGPADVGPDDERAFTVDFTRTFDLRSVAPGSKLRLRVPLPLTGDYLTDLNVTPEVRTAHEAKTSLSPGRLEVRMTTAGEAEASIGARLSFKACRQEPALRPASDPPDALYLSDKEGLIVVTERIRALARSLAGVDATALDAVRAFWDYINASLMCGLPHYDQVDFAAPCDWVLDSGWFDCQLGSALFIALCRAHGLPARLIGGHLLYQRVPANHYWAEVWLEDRGWMPFDFISWELSEGGRDPAWRDRYFGRLDYRIITERLPRDFTGALGVPIPPAWCMLQVPSPGGMKIDFLAVNGTTVYSDTVCVKD